MVNIIHPFIHEYDFPYHNYLKEYKTEIINNYFSIKKKYPNVTDYPISLNHPLSILLEPKLNTLIKENYYINEPLSKFGFRTYIQNNQNFTSVYHNHLSPSSISATFYLDPPKDGGEIKFLVGFDEKENQSQEIFIKPKSDKVYVFPYWLFHSPTPQKDEEYRICFNWGYSSPQRPVHKMTLLPW